MSAYPSDGRKVGTKCKIKICANCKATFPTRVLIDGKSRDLTPRRYCLVCSPFNNRNSKQLERQRKDGIKTCPRCSKDFPIEHFQRPSSKTGVAIIREGYCKTCRNAYRLERKSALKQFCIEYKGGKCQYCGYNRYSNALSFHHLDPSSKDFEISRRAWINPRIMNDIKTELDKCVLLCLNCHAEEHARLRIETPLQ